VWKNTKKKTNNSTLMSRPVFRARVLRYLRCLLGTRRMSAIKTNIASGFFPTSLNLVIFSYFYVTKMKQSGIYKLAKSILPCHVTDQEEFLCGEPILSWSVEVRHDPRVDGGELEKKKTTMTVVLANGPFIIRTNTNTNCLKVK
jgi:hypothetical protein